MVFLVTFLTLVVGYLFGSVSFSIIVTRSVKNNADIRTMGSGNAGATNVLRSIGWKAAALTAAGDLLKSVAASLIGQMVFLAFFAKEIGPLAGNFGAFIAGVGCIFGHVYPCFFGFHGGKAILSVLGMSLIVSPVATLFLLAIWGAILAWKKTVSLSCIIASTVYPLAIFCESFFRFRYYAFCPNLAWPYVFFSTSMAIIASALILFRHRSNIKRLKAGTESRINY